MIYKHLAITALLIGALPLLSSAFAGIALTYPLLGVTLGLMTVGLGISIYAFIHLQNHKEDNSKFLYNKLPTLLSFGSIVACVIAGASVFYTNHNITSYCLSTIFLNATGLYIANTPFEAQIAIVDISCLAAGFVLAAIIGVAGTYHMTRSLENA